MPITSKVEVTLTKKLIATVDEVLEHVKLASEVIE